MHQRRPDVPEPAQVLRQGLVLVVADEGADHIHAQQLGGVDHLAQVIIDGLAVLLVGVKVVGVVGQGRDLQAVGVHRLFDRLGVEVVDVDVAHSRVPAHLPA